MEILFFNDKFVKKEQFAISPSDRGLLLGDGLFETIRIFSGQPLFLAEHWSRLVRSAEVIHMPILKSFQEIKSAIYKLLELNALNTADASIRITLTRGPGPRGLSPPAEINPTWMITTAPFANSSHVSWSVYISSIKRNEYSILSNIKSLNYLENIVARIEATKNGADEALLTNTANNIVAASCANLFLVSSSIIHTPPISDGILPGIARDQVLRVAEQLNFDINTSSITIDALLRADEIFLTNSLLGIKPVIKVNNNLIGQGNIGRVTYSLQTALSEYYQTCLAK